VDENVKQLLVCLISAYFAGEYLFQSNTYVSNKNKVFVLIRHAAIVAVWSYALCGSWTRWEIPLLILISYAIIDFIMATYGKRYIWTFMAIQIAHVVVIIVIAIIVVKMMGTVSLFWVNFFGKGFLKFLILFAGGIAVTKAGSIFIKMAVQPFLDQLEKHECESKQKVETDPMPMSRGFENGGSVIGQLERALIFLFVFVNQSAGIGFLIAAKSVFRFGEIKDRKHRMEAEYIIIGTLMSFGYGILVAYATKFFMELV